MTTAADLGDVFKALSDPSRRRLLDSLRESDGQTLTSLERVLPHLTRFGVMRHLTVLEESGLVTKRRAGRHKHHYLNAVPIQLLADRWISNYTRPSAHRLIDLKHTIEEESTVSDRPQHINRILIQCNPERLWDAITKPELSRMYYHGTMIESEFVPGGPVVYLDADGIVQIEGEIVEVDRPRRLVMSCRFLFDDTAAREAPARVSWELEPLGSELTQLTVIHEADADSRNYEIAAGGYTSILSGLKTVLETGKELSFA